MNVDQRKALIDAMLALGTVARAMPLGELYEAIERDEKAERTRDGRWTQSLIHSVRWLTDVSGELERVRAESRPVPYTVVTQQCQAGKTGPTHTHQCQKLLYPDGADHIGQHICTCGHSWVATPPAANPCGQLSVAGGKDHNCTCYGDHGEVDRRAELIHMCKCGHTWIGSPRPGSVDIPVRDDIPDDWFMPGTN